MKKSILLMAIIGSFTVNANQSLRDDAILVEDLEYKLAAGFKADDVIYRLPEAQMKSESQSIRGGAGGTVFQSYVGGEARGRESDFAYESSGQGNIWRTGGDNFADIMLVIPEGNEFEFVRVWGFDTDVAEDLQFFTFERCLPTFAGGPIVQTVLDDVNVTTSSGAFSNVMTIPDSTFIDNQACTYATRVRFDSTGASMQVYKVRAQSVTQP